MRRFAIALSLLLVAACAACSGGSSYTIATGTPAPSVSVVPTVIFAHTRLHIGDSLDARAIDVEIAANSDQSVRGLGYRDALDSDAGMLFDLRETRVPTFWMKGMRFALDMVWIGEDRRVVSVTPDVPPQPDAPDEQLRRYSPGVAVRYVLELNSGAAIRLGIAPSTPLSFTLP